MAGVTAPKVEKVGGYDKWEVENWLDTILRSYDLREDKKKMKAIKMLAVEKKKHLSLIKIK
jgi:hypothetical protein